MKQYLRILKALAKLNFSTLLIYRASLINGLISSVAWGIISISTMLLLTLHVQSVYGWSKKELLVLNGSYSIMIGLFHIIFSRNFERFSYIVEHGDLDFILLKPLDSQFLISFWLFNYSGFARLLIGILFTFYVFATFHISASLINIIGFVVLLCFGIVVLYSIWFLVSTIIIWHPKLSNLVDFLFNFSNTTRYPQEIVREANFFLFLFLLPLTFIVTVPTKVLFQKVLAGDIAWLLFFSVFLFFSSRIFWKFALRSYASANS